MTAAVPRRDRASRLARRAALGGKTASCTASSSRSEAQTAPSAAWRVWRRRACGSRKSEDRNEVAAGSRARNEATKDRGFGRRPIGVSILRRAFGVGGWGGLYCRPHARQGTGLFAVYRHDRELVQ